MNKNCPDTLSFEDRIDILFRELELAIKWQQPSILFATFDTQDAHEAAEVILEKRLTALGQTAPKIQLENSEIAFWLSESDNLEKTVFFVEGVKRQNNENGFNAYSALDILQDFFIENRIRIVFWLTEEQAVDLAHFAPDFWSFRHRVVEFHGLSLPDQGQRKELDFVDPRARHAPPLQKVPDSNINFRDLLINDLPEGEESIAILLNLLLTLGILHWRQGNFEKATRFLNTALNNGKVLKDKCFEAECLNAIALVNTNLGKAENAIEAYQQAIRLAPDQVIPWNNLGNLYIKQNRYDDAVAAFKKAIEQSPEDAVSWNGLGNAYCKKGYTDDAINAYQKAVELAPTFGYPWNNLGDVLTIKGQVEEAIAAYQKAIEINNHNASPWINLGKIFLLQNRKEDAIQAFQKAVEIEPNNIHALSELGNIIQKQGNDEEGLAETPLIVDHLENDAQSNQEGIPQEDYETSYFNIQPKATSAFIENESGETENDHHEKSSLEWNELGHDHLRVGEYDEAINAYINAIEQSKDFNWPYIRNLALAHYYKGKYKANASEDVQDVRNFEGIETTNEKLEDTSSRGLLETEQAGKNSTQVDPIQLATKMVHDGLNNPSSEWSEALGNFQTEEPVDMQQSTMQSNEQDYRSSKSDEGLQTKRLQPDKVIQNDAMQEDIQYGLDQLEGVSAAAEEIREEDNNEVLKILGNQRKKIDSPKGESEEVIPGKSPKTAFEWNELGNIYLKSGNHEKAIAAYIRAIELSPKFGWSYSNLAFVYCHQGKYSDAIPLYKKSIELFKSDKEKAISWNRLGDAYRRLKDRKRAKEAYQMATKLDSDTDSLITRARLSLLSNSSG